MGMTSMMERLGHRDQPSTSRVIKATGNSDRDDAQSRFATQNWSDDWEDEDNAENPRQIEADTPEVSAQPSNAGEMSAQATTSTGNSVFEVKTAIGDLLKGLYRGKLESLPSNILELASSLVDNIETFANIDHAMRLVKERKRLEAMKTTIVEEPSSNESAKVKDDRKMDPTVLPTPITKEALEKVIADAQKLLDDHNEKSAPPSSAEASGTRLNPEKTPENFEEDIKALIQDEGKSSSSDDCVLDFEQAPRPLQVVVEGEDTMPSLVPSGTVRRATRVPAKRSKRILNDTFIYIND